MNKLKILEFASLWSGYLKDAGLFPIFVGHWARSAPSSRLEYEKNSSRISSTYLSDTRKVSNCWPRWRGSSEGLVPPSNNPSWQTRQFPLLPNVIRYMTMC